MNKNNKTGVPRKDKDYGKEYFRKNPHKHKKKKEYQKKYMKGWHNKHPNYKNELGKKYKLEIFELLGNKCCSPTCAVIGGMNDKRCLQIDHIKGNGKQEKNKTSTCLYSYYKFILKKIKSGSKDYQLLCANCNWIKRVENKECPQRKKSKSL